MGCMRTALTAAAALLLATSALADDYVTHHFTATAARGALRRIVVDVPAGEVHVRNGAADRIDAAGTVRREYDSPKSMMVVISSSKTSSLLPSSLPFS